MFDCLKRIKISLLRIKSLTMCLCLLWLTGIPYVAGDGAALNAVLADLKSVFHKNEKLIKEISSLVKKYEGLKDKRDVLNAQITDIGKKLETLDRLRRDNKAEVRRLTNLFESINTNNLAAVRSDQSNARKRKAELPAAPAGPKKRRNRG